MSLGRDFADAKRVQNFEAQDMPIGDPSPCVSADTVTFLAQERGNFPHRIGVIYPWGVEEEGIVAPPEQPTRSHEVLNRVCG
jgi:hypothetical protein